MIISSPQLSLPFFPLPSVRPSRKQSDTRKRKPWREKCHFDNLEIREYSGEWEPPRDHQFVRGLRNSFGDAAPFQDSARLWHLPPSQRAILLCSD